MRPQIVNRKWRGHGNMSRTYLFARFVARPTYSVVEVPDAVLLFDRAARVGRHRVRSTFRRAGPEAISQSNGSLGNPCPVFGSARTNDRVASVGRLLSRSNSCVASGGQLDCEASSRHRTSVAKDNEGHGTYIRKMHCIYCERDRPKRNDCRGQMLNLWTRRSRLS